jgi:glyceraldehyde 3-phosphate dehydrogenase
MKIAINGFGRIGRSFFKQALRVPNLEIVAINDLGDFENLKYLLKYDTVYRGFNTPIPETIKLLQESDPSKLP